MLRPLPITHRRSAAAIVVGTATVILAATAAQERLLGPSRGEPEIAAAPIAAPIVAPATHPAVRREVGERLDGMASWYGPGFHGRRTASGEIYDQNAFTAASLELPFGTVLIVTHRDRSVLVRVNDRGPYVEGRFLDLSKAAAEALAIDGVGLVTAEILKIVPNPPPTSAGPPILPGELPRHAPFAVALGGIVSVFGAAGLFVQRGVALRRERRSLVAAIERSDDDDFWSDIQRRVRLASAHHAP